MVDGENFHRLWIPLWERWQLRILVAFCWDGKKITLPCEAREEGGGGHEVWQEGRMRFFLIQPRSLVSSTFCGLGVSCYLLPRRCTLSGR